MVAPLPAGAREEIVRAYVAGERCTDIAARYGITYGWIYRIAKDFGLHRPRAVPPPLPEDQLKRPDIRRWTKKHPEKRAAHRAVEYALKRGDLCRQACERCGSLNTHAHHDDYTKPLEVTWLCPTHHKARHAEMKALAEATPEGEQP